MVLFKELHKILQPGDIVTVERMNDVIDAVFIEWVYCKWKAQLNSYDDCKICNGYMSITDEENFNQHMCTGISDINGYSTVIKITKNQNYIPLLEDKLFKI